MRLAATAAIFAIAAMVGCRSNVAPAAACIPPGSLAVAAADLSRVRSSPIYPQLPDGVRSMLENYPTAQHLMAAWSGAGLLLIAQGSFRKPPAGGTLVAPGLAVSGSAEAVRAALAQHRTGAPGSPELLAYGSHAAGSSPIWVAVRGGVALPLSGNFANLNRLLRNLRFAALGVDLGSAVNLRLSGLGKDEAGAREFEESLRALLSLSAAGESRHPEIAALLDSVKVQREGVAVTAAVTVPAGELKMLAPGF